MQRTQNKIRHRKLTGEEISPAAPAGIRTRNLPFTSPALCQQAPPAPRLLPFSQKTSSKAAMFSGSNHFSVSVDKAKDDRDHSLDRLGDSTKDITPLTAFGTKSAISYETSPRGQEQGHDSIEE